MKPGLYKTNVIMLQSKQPQWYFWIGATSLEIHTLVSTYYIKYCLSLTQDWKFESDDSADLIERMTILDYDTWTPVSLSPTTSSPGSTTLSATPVINSSQPEKGKQKIKLVSR